MRVDPFDRLSVSVHRAGLSEVDRTIYRKRDLRETHVRSGIDHARKDAHALAVDLFGTRRDLNICPNSRYLAILDDDGTILDRGARNGYDPRSDDRERSGSSRLILLRPVILRGGEKLKQEN